MIIKTVLLFFIASLSCSAFAFIDEGEWSGQGSATFQYRVFQDDNKAATEDVGIALLTKVEEKFVGKYSKHLFKVFARADEKDSDRGLIRLEDAYFSWRLGQQQSLKFLVGYKIFNWTATEAFHPADMVNSRNYDSNLENLEKMGEFTIELEKEFDLGTFSLYLWPQFERPVFPGVRSRLGSGVAISRPKVIIDEEDEGRRVLQYGARLSLALDSMDVSFHAMRQIDRFFPLVGTDQFTFLGGSPVPLSTEPVPFYFMKNQYGLTAQIPWAGFSFKLEGAYRSFDSDKVIFTARGLRTPSDHTDVAFGFDYSFRFDNSDMELIVLSEMSSIFGVSDTFRAEISVFQKDVLVGFKLLFNDIMGSELTMTAISDIERDNERLYNFSYTRRLTDQWKFDTGVRIFNAPKKGTIATGLEVLDRSHHGYFNLTRYF